jgi:hypothetical protein
MTSAGVDATSFVLFGGAGKGSDYSADLFNYSISGTLHRVRAPFGARV